MPSYRPWWPNQHKTHQIDQRRRTDGEGIGHPKVSAPLVFHLRPMARLAKSALSKKQKLCAYQCLFWLALQREIQELPRHDSLKNKGGWRFLEVSASAEINHEVKWRLLLFKSRTGKPALTLQVVRQWRMSSSRRIDGRGSRDEGVVHPQGSTGDTSRRSSPDRPAGRTAGVPAGLWFWQQFPRWQHVSTAPQRRGERERWGEVRRRGGWCITSSDGFVNTA